MQASIFKLCQIPKFVYEIPRMLIMSIPFHIHSNSYILYTYTYPKKNKQGIHFLQRGLLVKTSIHTTFKLIKSTVKLGIKELFGHCKIVH